MTTPINKVIEQVVLDIVTKTWSWGTHNLILDQSDQRITKAITTLQSYHEEMMKKAVDVERKEWLKGNRCSMCGDSNLDSKGLADICGKCFEDE